MNAEITESKKFEAVVGNCDANAGRTWSTGRRTSRADYAMVPALTSDNVDAVFDEECLNFVQTGSKKSEPSAKVQSLASQLAILESQCVNLRRMLEVATLGH